MTALLAVIGNHDHIGGSVIIAAVVVIFCTLFVLMVCNDLTSGDD